MPAFMCSDLHIRAVVIGAYRCKAERCNFSLDLDVLSREANTLKAANVKSVSARYGDRTKMMGINGEPIEVNALAYSKASQRSPIELLKLVDCLEYQSCEFEGWKKSKASKLLDEYRAYITRSIPGYEKAAWDI
jgi:hypothetical protein